ncbi:MAG: TetR/AcrR family transcriptional regulator [bacterium]|nr:TetR/AcrR family transcriptional regulator [bacterium]
MQPPKQDRILQAALTTFGQRGFHRATMEDIALSAGVGKGTLYLYFPSKQALLEEIFRTGLEAYTTGLQAIASGPGSAARRLEEMAAFALGFAAANREFAGLVQEGPVGMREEFKRWLWGLRGRILNAVREVAADGVGAGEFRPLDPGLLAHVFLGGIHSLAAAIVWDAARHDPAATARSLVDLILAGARPPGRHAVPGAGAS